MAVQTLVVPFLNNDPLFAYGVEFGMLYARMRDGDADEIGDTFCLANQEQILLLASRIGWEVVEMEILDEFWFRLLLRRM